MKLRVHLTKDIAKQIQQDYSKKLHKNLSQKEATKELMHNFFLSLFKRKQK